MDSADYSLKCFQWKYVKNDHEFRNLKQQKKHFLVWMEFLETPGKKKKEKILFRAYQKQKNLNIFAFYLFFLYVNEYIYQL